MLLGSGAQLSLSGLTVAYPGVWRCEIDKTQASSHRGLISAVSYVRRARRMTSDVW